MPPEKEEKKENKSIHNLAVLQKVFNSADGILALEQIDELCGYNKNVFNPDPYKHAFNSGLQSVAVLIHNAINVKVSKDSEDKQ